MDQLPRGRGLSLGIVGFLAVITSVLAIGQLRTAAGQFRTAPGTAVVSILLTLALTGILWLIFWVLLRRKR